MHDDAKLLHRYAAEKSETAFTELVRRHLDLVYSAALRRTGGDTHRATDIAQQVFTTLARNAAKLSRHGVLTAWLYTATRNAAIDHLRADQRRRIREHEAHRMHEILSDPGQNADWERLRPVLDAAMDELAEVDRTAVLLRFFEKRSFSEIGATLHLTEDAARMRVERALEKLRALMACRGLTSTTTALGVALETHAVVASPAGLVTVVADSALGAVLAGGGGSGILALLAGFQLSSVVAPLAALVAIAAAIFLGQEKRAAEGALAAAGRENATAMARLRDAVRQAETAAQRTTELQQALDDRRRLATTTGPSATPRYAAGATEEFLATHPEARPLIDAMRRGSFETFFGSALQGLNLTPGEREMLAEEALKVESWSGTFGGMQFVINPQNRGGYFTATFERLGELLGETRFQRFIEERRWAEVGTLVKTAVAATYDSDTPFQVGQAPVVLEILKRHAHNRGDGRTRHGVSINWPAATSELSRVLAAPQLAALTASHESALARRNIFPYRQQQIPLPDPLETVRRKGAP